MKYTVTVGGRIYEINSGSDQRIEVDGQDHLVDFRSIDGSSLYSLLIDNRSWEALVERTGDEYRISIDGELYIVTVQDERTRKIEKALSKAQTSTGEVTVKAPMPGLVRTVSVQAAQEVSAGQELIILEAMKMENELRAPRAGTIKEIRVKAGDAVNQGQALVVIK